MAQNESGGKTEFGSVYAGSTAIFIVMTVVAILNMPEVNARHFFQADDWAWLYKAEFDSFSNLFSVLPMRIYNDRPIGAIAIKAGYELFGLSSSYFLLMQLGLHVLNCFLLYLVAKKYVGRFGALIAALLAGTWISANNAVFWTAAIFDVLGTLFCWLSIMLWQLAWNRRYHLAYLIGGAFVYFLAIRTKEFAFGLPVLLFLISVILERRSLVETIKSLLPYWVVMSSLGAAYWHLFQLEVSLPETGSNPYAFHFSSVAINFVFYFSRAFYVQQLGALAPLLAVAALLIAAVRSAYFRGLVIVGVSGFVLMLGPTLLLGAHQDVLYLYAPHFFLAFAIGSLFVLSALWRCFAISAAGILIIAPPNILGFSYLTNLFSVKTADYREQFQSFLRAIGKVQPGSTIFIGGLENYMNPFSYGPGNSVKVAMKDRSLKFVIEKPRDVLEKDFCATGSPKYFIAFHGNYAQNETALASLSCDPAVSRTSEP